MIDTRVERDIVHHQLGQLGPAHIQVHAAIAAPVVRNRAAAMRNDEPQRWEIFEEPRLLKELHKSGGVGVQIVRARLVEGWIARGTDMHHRRHVELHHLFVQRVPVAVGEWWLLPVAA